MDIEEENKAREREHQQRQHGPAVGARLYFNYTAGCESLVQSRCFPLLLSLPPFADEPWCTTEMRRNKNRRDGPPLQPSEPCPSASASVRSNSWSFLSTSLPPPYILYRVFCQFSLTLVYFLHETSLVLCPTFSRPAFIIDALRYCSLSLSLSFFCC